MSYSYDRRVAAVRWDPRMIDIIRKNTQANNHSGALVMGAGMLGAKKLEEKLYLVAQLVHHEGHIPRPLKVYQDGLYDQLMAHAKRVLTPEQFQEFYGAF